MRDESARRTEPAPHVSCRDGVSLREQKIDVLYLSPARFRLRPQVGVQRRIPWGKLVAYLSRATTGDAKEAAGAWSPALYRNCVRRKTAIVHVCALVVDVDEGGDVDAVAGALSRYACVVHETHSSTDEAPRCRAVLLLAEPVDTVTYDRVHAVVRAHLQTWGIVADAAAKDASRLSFAPVRRAGAGYRIHVVDGRSLSAALVLRSQPQQAAKWSPRSTGRAYERGAVQRATAAVTSAPKGARNVTLNRETYCLARLDGLDAETIEAAMLDAALAAGLPEGEATRTITGAIRARRGRA